MCLVGMEGVCMFFFPVGDFVQEVSVAHLLWVLVPFETIVVKYVSCPSA